MKISHSHYLVISITMVILLLLFQFSNISTIFVSHADTNPYAEEISSLDSTTCLSIDALQNKKQCRVAILGRASSQQTLPAREWCSYTKQHFFCFSSLKKLSKADIPDCYLLIVYPEYLNGSDSISYLCRLARQGMNIIFAALPNLQLLRQSGELRSLLGIRSIAADSYELDGITLFEDFLMGGKHYFNDMKLTLPYFTLNSGTKVYMTGILEQQKSLGITNEELPPVIWRNTWHSSFVFVSNSSFLSGHTGIGFFTAMMTEMNEDTLYPVINAQTVTLQNYPCLSSENREAMQERYSYDVQPFFQNVLWPSIVSILHATGDKMTCIMAPCLQYDQNGDTAPEQSALNFYMKQIAKHSGNIGISGTQTESSLSARQKLNTDFSFYNTYLPDYTFTIFAPDTMKESDYAPLLAEEDSLLSSIRTLYLPYAEQNAKPLFSYYNTKVLRMYSTMDGFSHTDEEELRLRSLQTALGVSNTCVDFSRIIYPRSENDDWTNLSTEWSRYQETYWKDYRDYFDSMTVSEADTRIRQFLALDYAETRNGNTISLQLENFQGDAWFIYQSNAKEIKKISGGSFQKLDGNRYLIHASQSTLSIRTSRIREKTYY